MNFSLEQLKLADELCYLDDFERLAFKHLGDKAIPSINLFKEKKSLINWIFAHSRATMKRGYSEPIHNIIYDLIPSNDIIE